MLDREERWVVGTTVSATCLRQTEDIATRPAPAPRWTWTLGGEHWKYSPLPSGVRPYVFLSFSSLSPACSCWFNALTASCAVSADSACWGSSGLLGSLSRRPLLSMPSEPFESVILESRLGEAMSEKSVVGKIQQTCEALGRRTRSSQYSRICHHSRCSAASECIDFGVEAV